MFKTALKQNFRILSTYGNKPVKVVNSTTPLTPNKKSSVKSLILKRLHILQWLPNYSKSDVISDFIAGLTVGLTMIPQSIAYANLAGLPAQYGLYTAFIGSFTYIFFGTIKEVSIGPTTLMSMLTFSYTEGLGVDYVILLTFLAGCVELAMGVLKLGFLVDFISPCVTSGFTSSMAVVMTISQLKNLFGLRKFATHGFVDTIHQLFLRYKEIRLADTILGVCGIVFLFAFKHLPKVRTKSRKMNRILWFLSISRNVLIVIITTLIAYYFHEFAGGAPFILSGKVPQGLPDFRLPTFSTNSTNGTVQFPEMVQKLGTAILVLPIAAVLANVAIAKAFADGVIVDATQEMMTLGLCNIFGSCIQAMPSCGAFTRSAVASSSDVRTPLQGVYSGTIIIMALSFLTPYFFYIPRTTLGAILISAVITLFDYSIFPKLWRSNRFDFYLTLATLGIGTFLGLELGIILGGLLNLLVLLKIWARPQISTEIRPTGKEPHLYIKPEMGLFYPCIDYFTTKITKVHNFAPDLPIVIDFGNVVRLDYSACQMLVQLIVNFRKKLVKVYFVNLKPEILAILKTQLDNELEDIHQSKEELKENCDIPLLCLNGEIPRKMSFYDV